jgi:hypothetical protein
MKNKRKFRINAVGDISFVENINENPNSDLFLNVKRVLNHADLVVGNLEEPLFLGKTLLTGKCTLQGNPDWAPVMREAGIHAVSLANNHIMDFGPQGLIATQEALDQSALRYFGAGVSVTEAVAPLYIDANGTRVAFLGRSSVIVNSPCYATEESPGVARLDLEEAKKSIKECKNRADFTVLVLHWGIEHYSYPTPNQRREAKELIEAGADLIIGHHPHVLQGIERIEKGLVCYSLGNFLFDDIAWSFVDREGKKQEKVIRLTEENRKGGIVKVSLSREGVSSYEFIPTYIQHDGTITIENTSKRQKEFNRLCSRLHWPAYSLLWRLYSLRQEWKLRLKPMTISRLKWANLKKLRPKHFKELYHGIKRSGKITSEKSTNPYE